MSLVNFPACGLTLLQLEDRCTPATFTVRNTDWNANKADSLPWAIAQANSPTNPGQDAIVFDFNALGNSPVFFSTSTLVVQEGVNIFAGGGNQFVTIVGDRPFEFAHTLGASDKGGKESVIRGGSFAKCSANMLLDDGGAIKVTGGQLTVSSTLFTENTARKGGAIFVGAEGTLVIAGNDSPVNPAAYPELGGRNVALFQKNEANTGGAVWVDGEVALQRGWFIENEASTNGGAIGVGSNGKLNAVALTIGETSYSPDVSIRRNEAIYDGGGIYYGSSKMSELHNVSITGNKAIGAVPVGFPAIPGRGGGVFVADGELKLFNGSVSGNQAWLGFGGGVFVSGGTLSADTVTFENNTGGHHQTAGGGKFNHTNCTFD